MITGSVVCASFKKELLLGLHDFANHEFWMALYDATAPLDVNTTAYTATGEITAIGYTATGKPLGPAQVLLDPGSRVAIATFADPVWDDSVIVARAALIYNYTMQGRAVGILDFVTDRTSNHGPFHVVFPPADPSKALIRIL